MSLQIQKHLRDESDRRSRSTLRAKDGGCVNPYKQTTTAPQNPEVIPILGASTIRIGNSWSLFAHKQVGVSTVRRITQMRGSGCNRSPHLQVCKDTQPTPVTFRATAPSRRVTTDSEVVKSRTKTTAETGDRMSRVRALTAQRSTRRLCSFPQVLLPRPARPGPTAVLSPFPPQSATAVSGVYAGFELFVKEYARHASKGARQKRRSAAGVSGGRSPNPGRIRAVALSGSHPAAAKVLAADQQSDIWGALYSFRWEERK